MAADTILVVDDNPLNLKLVDLCLRSHYKVQSAPSAQVALDLLRTVRPDLMLIDVQMPGMDGLELIRRLKADPKTVGIAAVALTASSMRIDEENAFAAGCDAFLTKPVSTRTLASWIQTFLDSRPVRHDVAAVPAPAARSASSAQATIDLLPITQAEIDNLRHRFLSEGLEKVQQMLVSVTDRTDVGSAQHLLHQWIGAAGLLGYTVIAERAGKVEELLRTPIWAPAKVRELLFALQDAFAEPDEVSETPLPASIQQELCDKRIALVALGDQEADLVCSALSRVGAKARLFGEDEATNSPSVATCDAVIVHVRPETIGSAWLREGASFVQSPLILLGTRADVLSLDRSIQAHAAEFLIDNWETDQVLMRLSFALSRGTPPASTGAPVESASPQKPARPTILLADDDPTVLTLLRSTLESYQMECQVATTGPMALQMIRESGPSAVVLDVNMPGMNGFDVLRTVRAEVSKVKVLLLTARGSEGDIVRGFDLGADDYLVKPFSTMELVSRLKRLLPR